MTNVLYCEICEQPAAHLVEGICWYCWQEHHNDLRQLADDCQSAAREMQAERDAYHAAVYEEELAMERRQHIR